MVNHEHWPTAPFSGKKLSCSPVAAMLSRMDSPTEGETETLPVSVEPTRRRVPRLTGRRGRLSSSVWVEEAVVDALAFSR